MALSGRAASGGVGSQAECWMPLQGDKFALGDWSALHTPDSPPFRGAENPLGKIRYAFIPKTWPEPRRRLERRVFEIPLQPESVTNDGLLPKPIGR